MDKLAAAKVDIGNLLRTAYREDPHHPATARRYARYLYSTDAHEELVRELSSTVRDSQASVDCLYFVGLSALVLGDTELAEWSLSRATSRGHNESMGHWVKALRSRGKAAEAYSLGMRRLNECPNDDAAGQAIFGMLLTEERHQELWELCSCLRANGGWTVRLVSAMALAAHEPWQKDVIRQMTNHETWLQRTTIDVNGAFAIGVNHHLNELNLWTPLPRTKATVGGGRRIESLQRFADMPPMSTLFARIGDEVTSYWDRRARGLHALGNDHPMVAMRPDCTTLTSWAVAVNLEGHEEWHIHPDGWLSGVFYVEVPDPSGSDAPNAGQIEFGPYPLGPAAVAAVWPNHTVQPRTGDLLLFPSYLAHRTWPTGLTRDRLCIAFDVLRKGIESTLSMPERVWAQSEVNPNTKLVRHPRAVYAVNDSGSHLIMNLDSGRYLATDDTGMIVWDLIREPLTTKDITRILLREFDGVEADIARDLASVLRVMMSCGVVEVH